MWIEALVQAYLVGFNIFLVQAVIAYKGDNEDPDFFWPMAIAISGFVCWAMLANFSHILGPVVIAVVAVIYAQVYKRRYPNLTKILSGVALGNILLSIFEFLVVVLAAIIRSPLDTLIMSIRG